MAMPSRKVETLVGWVNAKLALVGAAPIQHSRRWLSSSFRDGIVLGKLIEAMTGQVLSLLTTHTTAAPRIAP